MAPSLLPSTPTRIQHTQGAAIERSAANDAGGKRKKNKETMTSAADKSPSTTTKADAAAVVETTNKKNSPKKIKRSEYFLAAQQGGGGGDEPSAKKAKELTRINRVVVHHPNKAAIEIAVGAEGASWTLLARHFVEKSLLYPPQLFHLLSSLSPSHQTSYLFRYGDGYATIIIATWATEKGIDVGVCGGEVSIEANITLKPRDGGGGDDLTAAWQRWNVTMKPVTKLGDVEPFDMANDDDGVVHVDLVVEKVGLAKEQRKGGGEEGEGGREIGGNDRFHYAMTQTPYPVDNAKTNVLYVKEHLQFSRVVDKFHVEKLSKNTAVENYVNVGGGKKAAKTKAAFNNAAEKIQAAKAAFPAAAKKSAAEKEKVAHAKDAFPGQTKVSNAAAAANNVVEKKKASNSMTAASDIAEKAKALVAAAALDKAKKTPSKKSSTKKTATAEEPEKINNKGKPKRPLNAYMIFANEARQQFQEKNPNSNPKEITSKLGEAWRALDYETKHRFKLTADEAMSKLNEEHGEDALLMLNRKDKKKGKKLATNSDIAGADSNGNGSEIKKRSLDGSSGDPPHMGENSSSDVVVQPAKGLPNGWTTRVVHRKNDESKSDTYWFSPQNSYRFNSKRQMMRYCACLEQAGGDESAAFDLYSKDKKRKPDDAPAAVENSAKNDNNGKRKSDAVATTEMESSAKKKTSAADRAHVSKAEANLTTLREKKRASNAVVATNDNAAAALIAERAKALVAATALEKKASYKILSTKNTTILKKPQETMTSAADKAPLATTKADAAAVVETTNKKNSPQKIKRSEYFLAAQEGGGGRDEPSAKSAKESISGGGGEHNNVPAVKVDAVEDEEAKPKPPKRPLKGLMKFASDFRSKILSDNPNLNTVEVVRIVNQAKKTGEAYRALTEEQQQMYQTDAKIENPNKSTSKKKKKKRKAKTEDTDGEDTKKEMNKASQSIDSALLLPQLSVPVVVTNVGSKCDLAKEGEVTDEAMMKFSEDHGKDLCARMLEY